LMQQPPAVNLLNGSTPWEKDSVSKITENPKRAQKKNYIEGVPEGFFEDEKLNSRVAETVEKEANMEQEYANFLKELDEAKHEEERREESAELADAIEHDIDLIDEQVLFRQIYEYLPIKNFFPGQIWSSDYLYKAEIRYSG
uniref:FAM192A_Fyv6_N domain-containing protein n=1 Tax=Gongylonema pulchrum TaxID=637853 RepID=A0A183EWA8_9BILA